ncbi:MAG: cytochrome c biogenesis CcdA family protein [Candidatus Dormibacteria bacterium]
MLAALSPSVGLAFAAGLLSFLSPCVFPLVPAYAAYLGGRAGTVPASPGPVQAATPRGAGVPVLANGVAFVLGFSAVFVALFYVLQALEVTFLLRHQRAVNVVAGAVVIVLALQTLGLLRIGSLMREWRVSARIPAGGGLGASLLLGVTFAAGWTPCIGPQLGAILQLAVSGSFGGLPFMLVYCAGLAIPFLIVAALADRLQNVIRAVNRRLGLVNLVAGGLLLVFGLLLVSDRLTVLSQLSASSPFNL